MELGASGAFATLVCVKDGESTGYWCLGDSDLKVNASAGELRGVANRDETRKGICGVLYDGTKLASCSFEFVSRGQSIVGGVSLSIYQFGYRGMRSPLESTSEPRKGCQRMFSG